MVNRFIKPSLPGEDFAQGHAQLNVLWAQAYRRDPLLDIVERAPVINFRGEGEKPSVRAHFYHDTTLLTRDLACR